MVFIFIEIAHKQEGNMMTHKSVVISWLRTNIIMLKQILMKYLQKKLQFCYSLINFQNNYLINHYVNNLILIDRLVNDFLLPNDSRLATFVCVLAGVAGTNGLGLLSNVFHKVQVQCLPLIRITFGQQDSDSNNQN
jgi:hypothetical protein